MRETHWNGLDYLTDNAGEDALTEALKKTEVASAELHKPGSVITRSNGKRYAVNANGQWYCIDKRKRTKRRAGR